MSPPSYLKENVIKQLSLINPNQFEIQDSTLFLLNP